MRTNEIMWHISTQLQKSDPLILTHQGKKCFHDEMLTLKSNIQKYG